MTTFPQIGQSTLEAGQAGAEVTVNTALLALDTFIFPTVASQETAPPGSPAEGDRHLVIATATGAFAGMENNIAIYWGADWVFYTPPEGAKVKDLETGQEFYFTGSAWMSLPGLVIPFITATVAWGSMPLAVTEYKGATAQRWVGDLRGKKRIRISNLDMALDSTVTGAKVAVQYSVNSGSSWAYCDAAGANSGPNALIDGSGSAAGTPIQGAWVNLDSSAKAAGVWLRIVGLGGDGAASPQFGRLEVEVQ